MAYRAIQHARDNAQAGLWGSFDWQEEAVVAAFSAVKGDVLHSLYQAYRVDPSQAYAFAAQDYEDSTQPLLQKAEDRLKALMTQYGVKDLKLPSHFIQGAADVRVVSNAANAVASTVVNVFLPRRHLGLSGQSGAPLGFNYDQFAASSSQNRAGPNNHGGDAPRMNPPRHGSPSRHVHRSTPHSSQSLLTHSATLRQGTHHGVSADVQKLLLTKVDTAWVYKLYHNVTNKMPARLGKETAFNEVWKQKQHDLKAVLSEQRLNPELEILHQKLYQVRHSHDSRKKEDLVQHIVEWFDKNC